MSKSMTSDADGNAVAQFGSKKVTFYPLTLKQMQQHARAIDGLRAQANTVGDADDRFAGILQILLASAQRGEPSTTKEDVEAVVDMRNWMQIMDVVLGKSAVTERRPAVLLNGAGTERAQPAAAVS